MVWFKVDDALALHSKAVMAGNAALGLWVRAGSWCAQQLTDGRVPMHIACLLGTTDEASALVDVGLWHRTEDGYRFHEWATYQPSRADVERDREAGRERQRRSRERRSRRSSGDVTPSEGVSHGEVTPLLTDDFAVSHKQDVAHGVEKSERREGRAPVTRDGCVTNGVTSDMSRGDIGNVTRDSHVSHSDPTRPDHKETSNDVSRERAKRARATQWPDGFGWDDVAADTLERFPNVSRFTFEAFEDHHRAKGSKFADWRRAWWSWCRREPSFAPARASRPATGERVNGWAALGAEVDGRAIS